MGANSQIQWTDHTINFWKGCHKVSAGCKMCYFYRDYGERWKGDPTVVSLTSPQTVNKVLKQLQPGDKVFTCSWSDFFIEEADQWRDWAWEIIKAHPLVHWQILTKRAERIGGCLPKDWGTGYPNVWLGVSIENYDAMHRLLTLHDLKNMSSTFKTFVSYEPALGYVDFGNDTVLMSSEFEQLDWIIVGGESGNETGNYRYRPCELEWLRKVVDDARHYKVPVFVKQLGTHLAKQLGMKDRHGGDFSEFPDFLKFRQFPV